MRSKTVITILVLVLTLIVAAIAFLIGMMLASDHSDNRTQVAEYSHNETTVFETTETVTETTETTTDTTEKTETETTTETTETETKEPKPTISNAYVYYFNTGAGIKVYIHVDGSYDKYQYQLYNKLLHKSNFEMIQQGESREHEFLVADGMGGDIETFKVKITAWNADESQSVEQWAYQNDDYCEDGTAHPPKKEVHLFGGYVSGVKKCLNLRIRPDANSISLAEIPDGMQLDIYQADVKGWYWTQYYGTWGYVNAKYIKEIEPYDPVLAGDVAPDNPITYQFDGYVSTKGDTLNLRSQPNTNSEILARIPNGTMLHIYSDVKSVGWYWTEYNGKSGYVSAQYISQTPPGHSSFETPANNSSGSSAKTGIIQSSDGQAPLLDYPSDVGGAYDLIPNGSTVEVLSVDGNWVEVKYNGIIGYIRKSQIQM